MDMRQSGAIKLLRSVSMQKGLFLSVSLIIAIFSAKASALGSEECKHLYKDLSPSQEAACKASGKGCLVNIWDYAQCRLTAPQPIEYLTIDGSNVRLSDAESAVYDGSEIVLQNGVASSHVLGWPSRKSNIRVEYAIRAALTESLNWKPVGLYSPGSTYTTVNYATYIPSQVTWIDYISNFCSGGGYVMIKRDPDARVIFRLRAEDPDGEVQKSPWKYSDVTRLYYGSKQVCKYVGSRPPRF